MKTNKFIRTHVALWCAVLCLIQSGQAEPTEQLANDDILATALEQAAEADTNAVEQDSVVTEDMMSTPESETVATEETVKTEEAVLEVVTEEDISGVEVTDGVDDNKISISLDNVPLQDVVRMFTRISGANIVAGTNLQGNVTVNLQDVEWKPALSVILDAVNMALVERSPGIYTVVGKDALAGEPVVSDTVFLRFVTASNILPVIQKMLINSNATVSSFPAVNAIVVQETRPQLNVIKEVVQQLDLPRSQVLIEAKFVELNDEAIKDLGINWQVLEGYSIGASGLNRSYTSTRTITEQDAVASGTFLDDTRTKTTANSRDTVVDHLIPDTTADQTTKNTTKTSSDVDSYQTLAVEGLNFSEVDFGEGTIKTLAPYVEQTVQTAILSASDFALTLSALKQNNGVDIVSNPKILVANGETATIHVGRNEPNVVAVPQGDTGDRYAYQLDDDMPFIEIGVKLNVTPTVNTTSNINVKIMPELSRKLADKTVGESGTSFPITQIRKINTEFNLESGRTVAIGGLTESNNEETEKKIPLLGDIPFLGRYLFRHVHTDKVQDEVIIFVTVGVVTPENLVETSGIPLEGQLIHRHLAERAAAAEKELQKKEKGEKKSEKKSKKKNQKTALLD